MLLATIGFATVYTRNAEILTASSLVYGAVFLGLFLVVHLVRRFLLPRADPYLLPITALLSTLGILMIYRLNAPLALQQSLWLVVGLGMFVLVVVLVRHFAVLRDYKYLIGIAGVGLLLITAVFGREINGARLWVRVGGISFQLPELAKILLIVFFAGYLCDVRELLTVSTRRVLGLAIPPFRYLTPLLAVWGLSLALMIFMRDLGTGALFFGAMVILLYVATGRPLYVVLAVLLLLGGAFLLYQLFPHVRVRVDMWLNPWADPQDRGYQILQSLFALASGGLFGRGLGAGYLITSGGRPLIPALETDFIFSAIGEELGLVGGVAVILLYVIFVYRGLRIAMAASDDFTRLVSVGLASIFGLQAFLILGGVTKLIPLTGITLPFVSYGGSSIVSNFALLALLLLASERAAEEVATARTPVVAAGGK